MKLVFFCNGQGFNPAKHLTRGSLIKPDFVINQANGFQDIQHRINIELNGADRLFERKRYGTLSSQIINFSGFIFRNDIDDLRKILQIAFNQFNRILNLQIF